MKLKSIIMALSLCVTLSACLFEEDSQANPFVGTWAAVESDHLFARLGRDSLYKDSIWNRLVYPVAGLRADDPNLTSEGEVEYLSLMTDPAQSEVLDSIGEYFNSCSSEECLDTLYVQTYQLEFTKDSFTASIYRDGDLYSANTNEYSYSNDSVFIQDTQLDGTLSSPSSMMYEFKGDTLITPGVSGLEKFVRLD